MLSNRDIAGLATQLQVPLIVGDILAGKETLTDDAHYGLHEVISDLQPDSALLAIALSTCKITGVYKQASPGMKLLHIECQRIISEYGSLWLENAQDKQISPDQAYDVLVHSAEDLESLAELLELNSAFLRSKDEQAHALCEILYIQAGAHAVIAEEFISAAHETLPTPKTVIPQVLADNVIPFPIQQNRV
jgi:hypothetical protein